MAPRWRRDGSTERTGGTGRHSAALGRQPLQEQLVQEPSSQQPDHLQEPAQYGVAPPVLGRADQDQPRQDDLSETRQWSLNQGGNDDPGAGWASGNEDPGAWESSEDDDDDRGWEDPYEEEAPSGPELSPAIEGPYTYKGGGYGLSTASAGYTGAGYEEMATSVMGEGAGSAGGHPDQRAGGNGPWPLLVMVTAVAVIAAAVALAVTSTNRTKLSNGPTANPTLSTPASAKSSGRSVGKTTGTARPPVTSTSSVNTTRTSATSSSTTAPTTTTTVPVFAQNLVISAATKQSLVNTWLATNPGGLGMTGSDVAGTVPGEVFYGYDLATSTYFATASFQPSQKLLKRAKTPAGQSLLAQFQDNEYVFSLTAGSGWTLLGVLTTGNCPGQWVPKPVLEVWGMCGLTPPAT